MSLVACTTLRTVPEWQTPAVPVQKVDQGLKPGDKLTVTTTDNLTSELVFVALTANTLQGVGKDKKMVEISRDHISLVERREISALKTTGLIGAIALATLLIAMGAAEGALASEL